jgi:hypothetical protein
LSNRAYSWSLATRVFAAGVVAVGCAGVKSQSGSGGSGDTSGSTATGGTANSTGNGGGQTVMPMSCNGPCTDFPAQPENAVGVDPNSFNSTGGAAPCITEPVDGSLFPNNWLRPRVRVPGATALKVTVHVDPNPNAEANDPFVAYASGETWTMDASIWKGLAMHVEGQQITLTVQTPTSGTGTVHFKIAPVGAGGSMVFWSADPTQVGKMAVESMPQANVVNDSYLLGFSVGDESVTKTLSIDQVQQEVLQNDQHNTRTSRCIGCHTGTPDGNYVSYVDAWPWPSVFANVTSDATMHGTALPNYLGCDVTPGTACMTTMPPTPIQYAWGGPMTFSKTHWTDPSMMGERIAITSSQMLDFTQPWTQYDYEPGKLMWLDMNNPATMVTNGLSVPVPGTAYGYLARTGDPNPAAGFPNWSHDGNNVVYVSAACPNPNANGNCGTQDGRLAKGPADLYYVPYAAKAGGAATKITWSAGKSNDANMDEYYPSFSPNDALIAFNAIPTGGLMYSNPSSELYVVPFGTPNATATRLAANDPPSCSGLTSPGQNNTWARWSPDVNKGGDGNTYYWLIFSSNQYGLPTETATTTNAQVPVSQLFMTAVSVSEVGFISTYPAVYLWNQNTQTANGQVVATKPRLNLTPAWQDFHIPIIVN